MNDFRARLTGALAAVAVLLAGCGGGGGGGGPIDGVTVTGTVLWLSTGTPLDPAATVQAGSRSARTSVADGSFVLEVPIGTSSVLVVANPTGSGAVSSRFDFPPVTGTTALGDLWIGPSSTTVQGRVLSSVDDQPIAGARIRLAGRAGVTDANGRFALAGVAYDASDSGLAVFTSLTGEASADGYFARAFRPESAAVGGVVELEDLRLAPDTGAEPPPLPFSIEGSVSGAGSVAGAHVLVRQAGALIRLAPVDTSRRYSVWVPVGTYTLTARNADGVEGPPATVTLTNPAEPVRQTLALP